MMVCVAFRAQSRGSPAAPAASAIDTAAGVAPTNRRARIRRCSKAEQS